MAKWKTITLKDALQEIEAGRIVLPVIQRELVWEKEKIILLFETLFKAESFGGIMTIIDPAKRTPLFEFRNFICNFIDGQKIESYKIDKLKEETTYIIDGQQRLSAFYIGTMGSYNTEVLYIDLLSESDHNNYNFIFSKDESKLPKTIDNFDGTKKLKPLWFRIKDLYSRFEDSGYDYKYFIDDLIEDLSYSVTPEEKSRIDASLYKMQTAYFNNQSIGLCGVPVNRNISEIENRLNIVKLFQKLNQGGTVLSGLELMRSVLKAYSAENERFLNHIKDQYLDIGFNQDEIIKLIFLLQDNHSKDITDIDQSDSDFIQNSGERLKKSLEGTRRFLKHSGLYEYYVSSRPSLIPLTFITYHIFHKDIDDPSIYFENHETTNTDYYAIKKWFLTSMLNHVFQRGNGWDPTKTGRRKILEVVKRHKNNRFPIDEIFNVYKNHSLSKFSFEMNYEWEWLNWYERSMIIYLLYGKPTNFRRNDIDHIHPKAVLLKNNVDWDKINILGNMQYLYYSDNRSKQDVEFADWITQIMGDDEEKIEEYIKMHKIPSDRLLWKSDHFDEFIEARRLLIKDGLSGIMDISN